MDHRETREISLAIVTLLLLAAIPFLPHVPQDAQYHRFADTRTLFGIANAMDTVSNLAFIGVGLTGVWLLLSGRLPPATSAAGATAGLFFIGLVATGLGSGWYHARTPPDDAGLAIDRYGMVIAFAGVLGLAAAHKVSERAGWSMGWVALVAGPAAVWWWTRHGNLAPYAVMQFGGMLVLVMILFWRSESEGPNWGLLVGCYALAKVLEAADAQIFHLTAQIVSGHTLKHLAAAGAGVAVIMPMLSHDGPLAVASARVQARHGGAIKSD